MTTSCEPYPAEGTLIPWDPDYWRPLANDTVNVEIVEVDSNQFCPQEENYQYFPGRNAANPKTVHSFCQMFGGEIVNTTTKEQFDAATAYITEIVKDKERWPNGGITAGTMISLFLTAWSDEKSEGNYTHHTDPNHPLPSFIQWDPWEPNGERGENCLLYHLIQPSREEYVLVGRDYSCDMTFPILCEKTRKFIGKIFGLCQQTYFDTSYALADTPSGLKDEHNIRRYFSGNYLWTIKWDNAHQVWKMSSPATNTTYAEQSDSTYPMGKKKWMIYNDRCNNLVDVEYKYLTFSPCRDNEFTCESGNCIPMEKRCDQKEDCEDVSDEKNCFKVYVDPNNYLKDKPPPALNGFAKCWVKVQVDLLQILQLSVVDMKITLKYNLFLEWYDPRITYYNLNTNKDLNGLVQEEKEKIWMPKVGPNFKLIFTASLDHLQKYSI